MKKVRILNPCAGHGDAVYLENTHSDVESYITQSVGDAERFVYERCLAEPETHFIVCGGDGTLNEVVNGIMCANAGEKAMFSVIPTGSGNDFARNDLEKRKPHLIDLITVNGRYCVNMINIGFDCDVVTKTAGYKEKHKGSTAYIMGLVNTLFAHLGKNFKVKLTLEDGSTVEVERELLLCAIANGRFCGGGFKAAPLAELDDGLLDVLVVEKVSRAKFISLVGDYRKGTFIDENGNLKKKFENVLQYRKCTSFELSGITEFCNDGEIVKADSVSVGVAHCCIRFLA